MFRLIHNASNLKKIFSGVNVQGQTLEPVTESVTPVSNEPFAALKLLPEVVAQESTVQELTSNPELLQALDESTCDSPEYGPNIIDTLANLWMPVVQKGMPNGDREKLLKEYLTPKNCHLWQSLEVKFDMPAVIPDFVRKSDKRLESEQQQLSAGIIAVNKALKLLLKGGSKIEAIRHLGNACYIASGLHASLTQTRIKFIIPYLDEDMLLAIQDTERDETLFGRNLSEKIEAVKASKATHSAAMRTSTSGNWNTSPRYRTYPGGRGGSRKPAPQNPRAYTDPTKLSPASNPRAPTTK